MTIFVTQSLLSAREVSLPSIDRREPAVAWSSLRSAHVVRPPVPSFDPSSQVARRNARRGFTLVELMIVVTIVGVLALLAVVGFSKLIGSSRTTEAIGTVNAIKVAQEAYHSETGTYANLSTSLCTTPGCSALYPQVPAGKSAVGDFKVGWGAPCGAACVTGMDWAMLPVHITGGVLYGYSTTAGFAGAAVTPATLQLPNGSSSYSVTLPTLSPSDWYLVTGVGDENMDGVPCVVLGTSFTNDLQVANDGE